MNIKDIWDSIVNFFKNNSWNIILFFIVLVVGIIAVKITLNIMNKILSKTRLEKIAQNFLMVIIKVVLYLILILALLSIVGVQITGILTAFSAVVLAVGVALQNNIANLANGIIIVSTSMFKKGDYIIVDNVEGSIESINFLFTTITTIDNKKVTIPNSIIVNDSVVNAGAYAKRRVDFNFLVAYESDVNQVKYLITTVMHSNGKVYLYPEPFCRLSSLGVNGIHFVANCWVDSEDYWEVYYYVLENVYNEFKRNNISIPYNQLEVRTRTDNVIFPYNHQKLPKRVQKLRKPPEDKFDLETASVKDIFKPSRKPTSTKKQNLKHNKNC